MQHLIEELKRRKVIRVGVAYVVVAWLLLQVADIVLPIYQAPTWTLPAFTTVLFLGFPVALILAWAYDLQPASGQRGEESPASGAAALAEALALPSGPSIAVLPFRDLSSDAEQRTFARAITNDIATGLTQTSSLRVVSAAGDTAEHEGNAASVGRELGVRYVLAGSVNKSGERLRITAKLTDAASSELMWSHSYDEQWTADDMFSVQDDIREQIVAALGDFHGVIFSSETEKNFHRPTDSLNAYECLSVALAYDKYLTEEYHLRARESLEQAVKIDPEFDSAWAHLSWIYTDEMVFGYNPLPDSMERALAAARRGVELAPNNYHNHWLLSRVHYFSGGRELFFAESRKALSLNSNDGTTLGLVGAYTAVSGEWEQGVALLHKAMTLNPRHPDYYYLFLSAAELHRGDHAGALRELRKMTFVEWPLALLFLIASNALTGNRDDASRYHAALAKIQGGTSLHQAEQSLKKMFPYADQLVATLMAGLEAVLPG